MGENLRIYIGGLGSNVKEDDLKKTFTSPQLGLVQSVEIIRTKGRSFAYLEFAPVSDKGLAKLFSTYNGCMWKGGRLKLEKARENYLSRLRREWTEDAELEITSSKQKVDASENVQLLQKPLKDQDIQKLQLNLFFPKLRRAKPVPFKGTGKHKYSFRRVEVPALPVHFCDCEEHYDVLLESAKSNILDHHETRINNGESNETGAYGVDENELNMMKLVLNKLLDRENTKTVSNEAELTEEKNKDTTYADNLQDDDDEEEEQVSDDLRVDDEEEEHASDEDNLVMNIVGRTSRRFASFEGPGPKTTAIHQNSLLRKPESFSRPLPNIHVTNKEKPVPDKKRKQPVYENNSNDIIIPLKKKGKRGGPHDSTDDAESVIIQPTFTKSGSKESSTTNMPSSRKSSWRDLVLDKKSTVFHISDILTDPNPDVKSKPRSDPPAPALRSSENVDQKNLCDARSTKPSASDNKTGRGPSWLHKSSWSQLVGDTNASAFSLSQILPGASFEKQETHQFGKNPFSGPSSGDRQTFERTDKNSPIFIKDENRTGGDSVNQEKKDKVCDPTLVSNMLLSNRAVPEIVISETCPFMKSAASMKEWMKTKAALSGSNKKNEKGKD